MSLPSLIDKNSELLEAAALFASGLIPLEEGAALAGMTADEFAATLEDPETLSQLETHLAHMKLSGKLTEARALAMLDRLLVGIESQINGMSPGMATRVAEMLLRISGLQERRAAEIKRVSPQDIGGFSVTIHLGGAKASLKNDHSHPVIDVTPTRISNSIVPSDDAVEVCDA